MMRHLPLLTMDLRNREPNEKSHGIGTQREPRNQNELFPNDFGSRSPVVQKAFSDENRYRYRITGLKCDGKVRDIRQLVRCICGFFFYMPFLAGSLYILNKQAPRCSLTRVRSLEKALRVIPCVSGHRRAERYARVEVISSSPCSYTHTPSKACETPFPISIPHTLDTKPLLGSQGNTITLAHPDEPYNMQKYGKFGEALVPRSKTWLKYPALQNPHPHLSPARL